ncbi:hypothetical protein BDA96_03G202800 [Sorghum bicolor]|uniref:Uncharacterized protein n=1 Tax=Sorghum bicolor TaxID=4558 RepID=A0A921UMV3_SORBI|nr:hypothetical protein BDA96_03G202800 [Sorghum bicolor]
MCSTTSLLLEICNLQLAKSQAHSACSGECRGPSVLQGYNKGLVH